MDTGKIYNILDKASDTTREMVETLIGEHIDPAGAGRQVVLEILQAVYDLIMTPEIDADVDKRNARDAHIAYLSTVAYQYLENSWSTPNHAEALRDALRAGEMWLERAKVAMSTQAILEDIILKEATS